MFFCGKLCRRKTQQMGDKSEILPAYSSNDPKRTDSDRAKFFPAKLELWRLHQASHLIFDGVQTDGESIESYLDSLRMGVVIATELPNSYSSYLKRLEKLQPVKHVHRELTILEQTLAKFVALFAHVANNHGCADLSLCMKNILNPFSSVATRLCKLDSDCDFGWLSERTIFDSISMSISEDMDELKDTENARGRSENSVVFLRSDYGWSVYYDTVGDKDPSAVQPNLLHISRGVPTQAKTGERRRFLRDSQYNLFFGFVLDAFPIIGGSVYVPQSASYVFKHEEYWLRRATAFELRLQLSGNQRTYSDPTQISAAYLQDFQNAEAKRMSRPAYSEVTSYHQMLLRLWDTALTPYQTCEHEVDTTSEISDAVKLGPDAVVVVGHYGPLGRLPKQKVIIYLTCGDKSLRWLALKQCHQTLLDSTSDNDRTVMLRHPECCVTCALEHTASLPGRWLLIL